MANRRPETDADVESFVPSRYKRLFRGLLAVTVLLAAPAAGAAVTANVVAMDQVIMYNRLGAYNPAGMIFALSRDVFPMGTSLVNETLANSCASVSCSPGQVQLRQDKRPRPLTLRVNALRSCISISRTCWPPPRSRMRTTRLRA